MLLKKHSFYSNNPFFYKTNVNIYVMLIMMFNGTYSIVKGGIFS